MACCGCSFTEKRRSNVAPQRTRKHETTKKTSRFVVSWSHFSRERCGWRSHSPSLADDGVQAPRAWTRCDEVQPDEEEEHGELALVEDRPRSARPVLLKVRHRHFTRQQKRHRPAEQSQKHQRTAEDFQHACEPYL